MTDLSIYRKLDVSALASAARKLGLLDG